MAEQIIADRYKVLSELGSGGMGTVFLAQDMKLKRQVAIKVLNENTANDASNIERFKREVKLVAGLSHPNVIGLYDFIEHKGDSYAVMEYAAGQTLDKSLKIRSLERDEVIRLARGIASGLSAAHQKGIVHRDIKPANILITDTGQVKILDFGLAKDKPPVDFNENTVSAVDMKTQQGTILGTVGYMAPEQVIGKPSDVRSDVFSFGVVLYEMLTQERAFKRDSVMETLTAILKEEVTFPALSENDDNDRLVELIRRCLNKEPSLRYRDLTEVSGLLDADELIGNEGSNRMEPDAKKKMNLSFSVIAAVAGLILLTIVISAFASKESSTVQPVETDSTIANSVQQHAGTLETPEVIEARQVMLPKMLELISEGDLQSAYELGEEIAKWLPDDTIFVRAFGDISIKYKVYSSPPGAEVYVGVYGEDVDQFKRIGVTPIEDGVMSPGLKHLVLHLDGYQKTNLLYGQKALKDTVISNVVLDPIDPSIDEMVRIPEGKAGRLIGMTIEPHQDRHVLVPEFLMDRFEVRNRDYQEFVDAGGYDNPDFWTDEFAINGNPMSFDDAMQLFVDTTGRPGPSTWEVGSYKTGLDEFPVQGVSWYEARAYARFRGKELPTLYHWLRARSVPGLDLLSEYISNSNINKEEYLRVGTNRGISAFGISDLFGNVAEWMVNSLGTQKLSLGGAVEDQEYFANHATSADLFDRDAKRGFRCIKNVGVPSESLSRDVDLTLRDYSNSEPITEELFAAFKSQFDYDPTPLDAVTEERTEESDLFTREVVSFASSYDADDRILAYLFLPKQVEPPFQTLVHFQSAMSIRPVRSNGRINVPDFFLKSGRAVIVPILHGQYERNNGLKSWRPNTSTEYANFVVKWIKDFRRTIDYLETRGDIDQKKLCFYGTSWGAQNFPIIGAIEPRIKISICVVGGLAMDPARSGVDQISFIHRASQPTLWFAGQYDPLIPYVESSQAAFNLLGTPKTDKRFLSFPTGHFIPRPNLVRESLDWLDKYFGTAGAHK